jgi:hypothetical protein
MFVYCCEALSFSEHGAYNRIIAARAARRFPLILELLEQGAVNLATVRILGPHLTPANHADVLRAARGLRKREVEELAARLNPKPDVPDAIRKLPTPAPPPALTPVLPAPASEPAAPSACVTADVADRPTLAAVPRAPESTVRPLSPDRYKMQLTISGDTLELFDLAKDLLSHAEPGGNSEAILKRALGALVDELLKNKFAVTDRPQAGKETTKGSRTIPAEVRRAVYLRDRGRCAFIAPDGRRCNERALAELHHVDPYAWGGKAVIDKIELRCRAHNAYEWERDYTALRMEEYEWHQREQAGRG